jgi:DNA-binding CsgD family transcriptional regulator
MSGEFDVIPSASQKPLTDALDKLCSARDDEARWLCGLRLLQDCGSQWITAGTAPLSRITSVSVRSSTPAALMRDYLDAGLHNDDPWMRLCAQGLDVDTLDTTAAGAALAGSKARLANLLADHGVRHAALVPCYGGHRTGGIVLYDCNPSSDGWRLDPAGLDRARRIVALFSALYQPEADRSEGSELYRFGAALTAREKEVLLGLWSGYRTARIAERMGIEPVTVSKHLAAIRRKLGARTREQALAIAIVEGLISI